MEMYSPWGYTAIPFGPMRSRVKARLLLGKSRRRKAAFASTPSDMPPRGQQGGGKDPYRFIVCANAREKLGG